MSEEFQYKNSRGETRSGVFKAPADAVLRSDRDDAIDRLKAAGVDVCTYVTGDGRRAAERSDAFLCSMAAAMEEGGTPQGRHEDIPQAEHPFFGVLTSILETLKRCEKELGSIAADAGRIDPEFVADAVNDLHETIKGK